ncbi:hypothetical protein [Agromyces ramosus]|uniref:DUF3040 family protein n=1 Tax=Agromyces ramosus TaxID=33879 RepID=A0ABU0R9T4_9MICO|nr:hypothetical protein [Agromyces ramosus]MDQ0894840.1 hypothetical protein [Agromyces ramosus]
MTECQGNGGPTVEDLEGGFERGGWARGAGDDTTRDHIAATFQRADAFLFGRRTYDILHEFWGTIEDLKRHPIGVVFALALLTAVICLIVFLISATKASAVMARYRRVQTELLLADASDGGPHDDDISGDTRPPAAP